MKPTRKRYHILAMIFGSVVINYLDRSNISIAAAALKTDLGFDTIQMGYIFSAFSLTYALLQIPGGIVVDRANPRKLYPILLVCWSFATLVQGYLQTFVAFIVARATIGVFEAPSYPMNNRIVSSWFPEKERASAIAIYTSGQFIGLAFLTPVLIYVQAHLGWQGLFVSSGIVGLVWAVIWYYVYRSPKTHPTVNEAELSLIENDGGIVNEQDTDTPRKAITWSEFKEPFLYRKLWGLYIGQFCLGTLFIFFLTWFPTYLVEYRGLDFMKKGWLASIPFLAAFFGVILSGFLSDYLVKKKYSPELARKAPILIGMFLSTSIIFANYSDSTFLVIAFLSLAFFGNGLASITWVFVSLMAPKQMIGLVGGVFNLIGGLAAVVTPIAIGYLVDGGDFKPALFYIGSVAMLGFFSYVLLVGKVERIIIKS
ncbi:ACS family D-galactonate transporter-like MFS transporter [Dyadobacter jejuensis]|uniref:ACS family D-galactonate transporter-like MFS transporter n=1 Tax=Dyadobacter jejuensis TaxID=1082580 RepID=A0A316AKE1_9BACT|nr:MFS transporter [Dyadobacter jejuensis]PWJ57972.1 ACS family D-galactonate transporter-like MFS transporter [Dyadobacter jejuensis]